MNKIYALTDYKDQIGSKWKSDPYRSGFDKKLLETYFKKHNYEVELIRIQDVNFNDDWKSKIVVYTSSEEKGLHYKSFIEDIILGLEKAGAYLMPGYDFLRANNNKVYMEILREQIFGASFGGNPNLLYGTIEELIFDIERNRVNYPCVIKSAEGAMSRGVFLTKNKAELLNSARKISLSTNYFSDFHEFFRGIKHKGYKKESKYQKKFIVQKFIPDLKNDWKILVFGDHYYVLSRGIKNNDFRASGSHYNYLAGSKSGISETLLDAVRNIYEKIDVPHLSLDFAFDGKEKIIHEFQALYFGTSTLEFSDDLYVYENDKWQVQKVKEDQEEEYVLGIVKYLRKHPELLH